MKSFIKWLKLHTVFMTYIFIPLSKIKNQLVVANIYSPLILSTRILFLGLITYTILIMAWVGDDSQITIRQIWNFINGDGITFNFTERVQAFTHPIWFLLLSSIIAVSGEVFNTILVISITLSVLSILILLKIEFSQNSNQINLLSPVFLLLFSWAFCDYTTSGLENPLSFLLVSILLYLIYYKIWLKNIKITFLILALLVLNRFDYLVLFGPIALIFLLEIKSFQKILRGIWPGLLVLFAWFSFATFYFGAPLPNTFYAKLNNDFSILESIRHGLNYVIALKYDIATLTIILSGILISFFSKEIKLVALSLGQILYILYIIWSGGDFMQGRFFSVLVLLSIGTIVLSFKERSQFSNTFQNIFFVAAIIICVSFVTHSKFPFLYRPNELPRTNYIYVGDERGGNYRINGLFSSERDAWIEIEELPDKTPLTYKTTCGLLGGLSLLDTSHYLIDSCALSDPFLSRISPIVRKNSIPGHYYRKIPTNYGEYLVGNITELPDNKLNDLLSDVSIVARGKLFSIERILAIFRLNTGYHNQIDFSDYKSRDFWIPLTTEVDKITLADWSQDFEYDKLTPRFHDKIRKFNGNLLVESKIPQLAAGIWFYIDFSYTYDVFINNELTFEKISQLPLDCKGTTLRFPQKTLVKSVKLVANNNIHIDFSGSNRIRDLNLLNEDEISTYENRDCDLEFYIKSF